MTYTIYIILIINIHIKNLAFLFITKLKNDLLIFSQL